MSKARQLANLGNVYDDGALSNRNLIINGAMQVAQRGTSFTGLGASDLYTLDRYKFDFGSTSGRLTAEQSTDAPNGFSHSFKLSCTTADTSIAASEKARIIYSFEGQNLASIAKGTSDAKPVTVSFYVKGNAAASYTCEFYDNDNNRQCSKIFNVTTDWTRVELTFPADTTGAFTYDNTTAVQLSFWLMAGSDYTSGTLNSSAFAASVQANRVSSSQTNFFDSTSRTFQITGAQLECSDTATPFEHRSYGDELARCQRYYQIWGAKGKDYHAKPMWIYNSTQAATTIDLPQEMRATPSFSVVGNVQNSSGGSVGVSAWALYYAGNWVGCSALEAGTASPTSFRLDADSFDSITSGGACGLYGGTDCYITLDSEL